MPAGDRTTQFDKALLGLRSMILSGEVEANSRLPEVQLSERFEISRTPLRKSMDLLVEEGLLERIETGGCRVASFTRSDIVDAIELRGVIEGTAARLAAERGASAADLAQCDRILDGIDAALDAPGGLDFDRYVALNAQFHAMLATLSGSAVMRREVDRVTRLPLASPSAFLQGQDLIPDFRASLRRAQHQHRALVAAIRDREGARAEALAREHARLARQNLDHVMKGDARLHARVPGLALVSAP
jgi:GntR family transcriptional regulator of vanillate catabolism